MDADELSLCDGSQLCQELAGDVAGTTFAELYGSKHTDRVIAQSEHFALIPDISPLLEGHLLLVPKYHVISFGHVVGDYVRELDQFVRRVLPTYSRCFGRPTILEHGSSTKFSPNACVTHAHWHFVPITKGIERVFREDHLRGVPLTSWHDLAVSANHDHPYIFYWNGSRRFLFDTNLSKRHQYLRTVVAEVVSIPEPEFDWSLFIRFEMFEATLSRARKEQW